ncbi:MULTISPECIES: TetR/AcrR family transcriptional regulator [unclassified Luteococcus]|uniref:TetR/AcrR family transcriptional regulator n=1 Tax=unclassified Luteococcus TaxID=2639923 RepID=UPI00313D6937
MPRVVDHDQRRAELASAAMELVRQQGVAALSVRNLAAASGWSSGAVRHYLPTHRAMVELVCEHVATGFERRLRAVPPQEDPVVQLRELIRAGLPLDEESRALSQVWFAFLGAEVHEEQGARAMVYGELAELFVGYFTRVQQAGFLLAGDPRAAAVATQAQLDGLTVHLLLGGIDEAQAMEALDLLLLRLVAAPQGAV